MGFRKRMTVLWGMAATLFVVSAFGAGGSHPAAGNPHPAAGNPHPARFGNPHPATGVPSVAAAPRLGVPGVATSRGNPNQLGSAPAPVAAPVVQPQEGGRIRYQYVGDCGPRSSARGAAPTIRGFNPNPVKGFARSPVTGFSSSPVSGFSPNPVKGFISPPLDSGNPSRHDFDRDRRSFGRSHPPTGFAGGAQPFPSWPGFTPSVPGPMAQDLRELIAEENGIRVFRLNTPPINGTAAEAESDLITTETLNTASPQSGF